MTKTIYFAGPLFSQAHRIFNKKIVSSLYKRLPDIRIILPQEYAKTLSHDENFNKKIFEHCISSIDNADVLLCILDGSDADSGTCIEMGYAYALKKTIIGVRTDLRNSEDRGVNLMVSGVCGKNYIWLPDNKLQDRTLVNKIISVLSDFLC